MPYLRIRTLRFLRRHAEALRARLARALPSPPPWRAPDPASNPRNPHLGISLGAALDFDHPMFADAMRTARAWSSVDGMALALDANGYPMGDASVLVWAGQRERMDGTYALRFTGQAAVAARLSNSEIVNQRYDAATNTTTAQLLCRDRRESTLTLVFTRTRRTPQASIPSGICDVKLMRPLAPGAARAYAPSTLFITPLLDKLAQFSVLRFMDFTATNWNITVNWIERVTPAAWSQETLDPRYGWQGKGAAWEYAILLCNQVNADAWLNIPLRASDDYVRQLARLWRDGSVIKGKTFPALAAHLKIYIEYGNEIWSKTFPHAAWVAWQARRELAAGGSPLDYDRLSHRPRGGGMIENERIFAARWCARRVQAISAIWRAEFGDATMMTRVRPLFSGAQSAVTDWQKPGLLFLDDYFNNAAGNFVSDPHPVNYYLYGTGGSAYNEGIPLQTVESDTLTVDEFFDTVYPASKELYYRKQCENVDWSIVYGLKRVAYEAGPGLDANGHSTAAKQDLQFDPRIYRVYVEQFERFCEAGGALYIQFLVANASHGLVRRIYATTSPKLQAIAALNRRGTLPLAHGVLVPAKIAAVDWNACSAAFPPPQDNAHVDLQAGEWVSYTFRTDSALTLAVGVTCRAHTAGSVEIAIDGAVVSVIKTQDVNAFQALKCVAEVASGIHALRIRALTSVLTLGKVRLERDSN